MSIEMLTAEEVLHRAAGAVESRATVRDTADGTRSMARTVEVFAALTGVKMRVSEGWLFMAACKLARSAQGDPHIDDYVDAAGYIGLAAEAAMQEAIEPLKQRTGRTSNGKSA